MNDTLIDEEAQRKLALSSFFGGAGYKIFEGSLTTLAEGAKAGVDITKNGPIDQNKLAELNFKLGMQSGFQKVLFVLQGLKSELEERNSPKGRR